MVDTGATGRSFPGWDSVPEDILPESDSTYDLGSSTKQWAALWVVLAMVGSLTIGGIIGLENKSGVLFINASTEINGSLNLSGGDLIMSGNDIIDAGNITADNFTGDGSALTNIGVETATALTIEGKCAENIGIGKAVYVSGAVGGNVQFSLADNTVSGKGDVIGLATQTKTSGQTILIRVDGQFNNWDTSAWADGDKLYLSTTGNLVNSLPASGGLVHVADVEYSHAINGDVLIHVGKTKNRAVPSGVDLFTRLGDNVGANKIFYRDYSNNNVAWIDSDGNANFTENVSALYFLGNGSLLTGISATETDPFWTGNQSSYSTTADIFGWNYYNSSDFDIADYFTAAEVLGFSYYNSSDFDINDYFTSAEVLGFEYWNSTFALFNKTYADTLYSLISEPLWSGNYSAHNDSWSSTYNSTYDALVTFPGWDVNLAWQNESNTFTENQNLSSHNLTDIECFVFDSGGKICSGS